MTFMLNTWPDIYPEQRHLLHTTVAKRKCTTGVMGDGSDLGVSGGTGTVGRRPWESYAPACSGADDNDNTTMDWGAILKNATPLHFAAMTNENLAVLQALLDAGANPDAKGSNDRTPLHEAVTFNEHPAGIQALLDAGANPDAKDSAGATPLHQAARSSTNTAVMQALLDAGANVNTRTSNDWTPLHYAALRKDNAAVLQFLLAAGADINARTSEGETPLDVATRKENWSAVQTLQDNGASQ